MAHLADRLRDADGTKDRGSLPDQTLAGDLFLACACARHIPLAGVLHSQLDLSLGRVLGADQEE